LSPAALYSQGFGFFRTRTTAVMGAATDISPFKNLGFNADAE
jgi:hypothetical protein